MIDGCGSAQPPFIAIRFCVCWDLYDHDEIGLPNVPAIHFAELDYFSKALFFAHGRHRHSVTEEHLRKTRHTYFAMISYIDEKIGKLLNQLEETGLITRWSFSPLIMARCLVNAACGSNNVSGNGPQGFRLFYRHRGVGAASRSRPIHHWWIWRQH